MGFILYKHLIIRFISCFRHGDKENVPTRSTFTGNTILLRTSATHNVGISGKHTDTHTLLYSVLFTQLLMKDYNSSL